MSQTERLEQSLHDAEQQKAALKKQIENYMNEEHTQSSESAKAPPPPIAQLISADPTSPPWRNGTSSTRSQRPPIPHHLPHHRSQIPNPLQRRPGRRNQLPQRRTPHCKTRRRLTHPRNPRSQTKSLQRRPRLGTTTKTAGREHRV